jgi:hypothetical protein
MGCMFNLAEHEGRSCPDKSYLARHWHDAVGFQRCVMVNGGLYEDKGSSVAPIAFLVLAEMKKGNSCERSTNLVGR